VGEINQALTATGGNGRYTWSLAGGSLPPGLSISTDVPSYFPAGASAGLIGVATTVGTYNFTLQATSGGQSVTQSASMHISALILKDLGQFPDAFVNIAYPSYQLTALNNAAPVTYTLSNSTLPPGMTLSLSGVFSGKPIMPGDYNWTVQFTDGADIEYRGFSINVYAIDIATPGQLPNAS
jgi:large repetitive protein